VDVIRRLIDCTDEQEDKKNLKKKTARSLAEQSPRLILFNFSLRVARTPLPRGGRGPIPSQEGSTKEKYTVYSRSGENLQWDMSAMNSSTRGCAYHT